MKILLVTSKASFTEQVRRALEENGSEVFYFDDRENLILPPYIRNSSFLWRLTRRIPALRKLNNRILGNKLLKVAAKIRPDLVLFNKAMVIKKKTLAGLNSMGIKTANWFLDNVKIRPYDRWFLENYSSYDYLFMFDSGAIKLIENMPESQRIIYLPAAVDPDAYKLKALSEGDKEKYSCDVCFVGAFYPERGKILNLIKDMGVNLKIFGWKGWEKTSLAPYYYGPLDVKETVKLYNCAKICLNTNTLPPVDGVNLKTFEIPAAGGFQLSDYRRDVESLFRIGEEIEIFHNEQDLREKVDFYLRNPELTKKIAQSGQARVIKDHTLKKRMNEMLSVVFQ